jgi:membrane protease YdiL (CAAX protease family)
MMNSWPIMALMAALEQPIWTLGWGIVFLLLAGISISISIYRIRGIANVSNDLGETIQCQLSIRCPDFVIALCALVPVTIYNICRILIIECSYTPQSVFVFLEIAILVPIIEEVGFRLLLPHLSKDGDVDFKDVLLFSVFFSLIHLDTNNINTFLFSLYAYFLMKKSRKVAIPLVCHIVNNALMIIFQ